jgi:hypothetical protein
MTPALRDQLEAARVSSGRTLSQEIEARLRLSFGEPQRVQDQFGGPTNYWLFRTMADRIRSIELALGQQVDGEPRDGHRWWQNRYTYDECLDFIGALLASFRPKGRRITPAHLKGYPLGKRTATIALANLEMALAGMQVSPALSAAAVPLVTKSTKAALPGLAKARRAAADPASKISSSGEKT